MYNKNYDRIDYQHHNSAGDIIEALVTPNHPVGQWVAKNTLMSILNL